MPPDERPSDENRLTRRNAEGLVNLALEIEQRARRFEIADARSFKLASLMDLHKAAALVGDAGRRLRALLENEP